jgi:hypothetical protein
VSEHALGRAASQRVENAVVSCGRHDDQINVILKCRVNNRLDDVPVPNDQGQWAPCRVSIADNRCMVSYMQKVDRDIVPHEHAAKLTRAVDSSGRRGGMIDRYGTRRSVIFPVTCWTKPRAPVVMKRVGTAD